MRASISAATRTFSKARSTSRRRRSNFSAVAEMKTVAAMVRGATPALSTRLTAIPAVWSGAPSHARAADRRTVGATELMRPALTVVPSGACDSRQGEMSPFRSFETVLSISFKYCVLICSSSRPLPGIMVPRTLLTAGATIPGHTRSSGSPRIKKPLPATRARECVSMARLRPSTMRSPSATQRESSSRMRGMKAPGTAGMPS